MPHAKRASSSYWLETTDGFRILLDAGADSPHRLAQEQLDWPRLDAIWISHFHWDHFAGLPALLFGMKWAPQIHQRSEPLLILGGPGLRAVLERINETNNFKLFDLHFPIEILEVRSHNNFEMLPGLRASVVSTKHKNESLALRLVDSDQKSFGYTSDTGFTEELIPFCSGVNLLLMECSFRKDSPVTTHLALADAIKIAAGASPERLVLTHLYAEWDQFDVVAEARRLWQGETIEATDGLRLII